MLLRLLFGRVATDRLELTLVIKRALDYLTTGGPRKSISWMRAADISAMQELKIRLYSTGAFGTGVCPDISTDAAVRLRSEISERLCELWLWCDDGR